MKLHEIQVNSYAGYKAEERPLNFIYRSKKHTITDIIHQAFEENISEGLRRIYKVETVEGLTFKLCYYENQDKWYVIEI